MNVRTIIPMREPVKLTVSSFLLLRKSGAFAAYEKAELLDGALWGVPRFDIMEEQSDEEFPIKLSVDQYALITDGGAFADIGKTELIDGLVYEMSPQYRPHGFAKDELAYRLRRALEDSDSPLHVATEQSVAMAPYSEPQPDIILTFEPRGRGPIPIGSIALIVEVSVSTFHFDISDKARIYAQASVPEYWVVDVNGAVIHQMWAPLGDAYSQQRDWLFGTDVEAATIASIVVPTDRL